MGQLREQIEQFADLFSFTARGIEAHLEADVIDREAITNALLQLNNSLNTIIAQED